MALRRMHSQGKGSVEKGLPVVEFSAVARSAESLISVHKLAAQSPKYAVSMLELSDLVGDEDDG
eukprot:gene11090-12923_t